MPLPDGFRSPPALQFLRYVPRPAEFLRRGRERFGTPFTARFAGFGTFVFLADKQSIQDVFTGPPDALHSGEANEFMKTSLGPSSLLVLDDEPHARQRRILLPPFRGERMKRHAAVIRDATLGRVAEWYPGRAVKLEDEFRELTLQVMLRAVFGARGTELEPFTVRMRELGQLMQTPHALLAELVPGPLRPMVWAQFLRRQRRVTDSIVGLIARRRAEEPREEDENEDVLATLLRATHEDGSPLRVEELRDHLFTLMIAGNDTTSVALAWTFDELLRRPDALARAREEVDAAFPSRVLEPDGFERLPYVDAVIKEALRLRTILPFVVRRTTRPFVAGGIEYPAGVCLCPSMTLAHSDPESWPEPGAFRPERFLTGRVDPYTWFPFGGGVRRCIGMAFALFEMRVVVATVLARVELEPPRGAAGRSKRRGLLIAPASRALARVSGVRTGTQPSEPAASLA